MSQIVGFRPDKEMNEWLRKTAESKKLRLSDLLRQIIRRAMEDG